MPLSTCHLKSLVADCAIGRAASAAAAERRGASDSPPLSPPSLAPLAARCDERHTRERDKQSHTRTRAHDTEHIDRIIIVACSPAG